MNVKLLSLELKDFKGVKSAKYDFADKTKISAENGKGKTTIAEKHHQIIDLREYQTGD